MLINDFSPQYQNDHHSIIKVTLFEILTAGIIFFAPVIFLLVLSAD